MRRALMPSANDRGTTSWLATARARSVAFTAGAIVLSGALVACGESASTSLPEAVAGGTAVNYPVTAPPADRSIVEENESRDDQVVYENVGLRVEFGGCWYQPPVVVDGRKGTPVVRVVGQTKFTSEFVDLGRPADIWIEIVTAGGSEVVASRKSGIEVNSEAAGGADIVVFSGAYLQVDESVSPTTEYACRASLRWSADA